MRSRPAIVMMAVLLAGAAWCGRAALAAGAATAPGARATIEGFIKNVLAILRDPSVPRDQRSAKVRDLAYGIMDFGTFARLSLGRYWRDLNDAQRTQFTAELKQHLSNTYGHTTDEYTNEDIVVAGDQQESNGDWTVTTRVIGDKNGTRQEVAKVLYRLRQTAGQWKIIDVTIDGVSLMANFRAQFQDVMTNGGFDKLIALLRAKNAAK